MARTLDEVKSQKLVRLDTSLTNTHFGFWGASDATEQWQRGPPDGSGAPFHWYVLTKKMGGNSKWHSASWVLSKAVSADAELTPQEAALYWTRSLARQKSVLTATGSPGAQVEVLHITYSQILYHWATGPPLRSFQATFLGDPNTSQQSDWEYLAGFLEMAACPLTFPGIAQMLESVGCIPGHTQPMWANPEDRETRAATCLTIWVCLPKHLSCLTHITDVSSLSTICSDWWALSWLKVFPIYCLLSYF